MTAKVGSLHTPHGLDSLFFLTWKGLCCGSYMMGVVLGHKLASHPHVTSTQTQPPLSGSSPQQMSRQPQLGAEAPILQLEKSGCARRILPRPLEVSLGAPSPRTHSTRTGELGGGCPGLTGSLLPPPQGPPPRAWAITVHQGHLEVLPSREKLGEGSGTSQPLLFPAAKPLRQNVPLAGPLACSHLRGQPKTTPGTGGKPWAPCMKWGFPQHGAITPSRAH